jgi:hypothetical protein
MNLQLTRRRVLGAGACLLAVCALAFSLGWWGRGSIPAGWCDATIYGTCHTQWVSGVNRGNEPPPDEPWELRPNMLIVVYDERGNTVASARSDSKGQYRISLPPGRYKVYAIWEGMPHPPSERPGTDSLDSRARVNLLPWEKLQVDFDVHDLGK